MRRIYKSTVILFVLAIVLILSACLMFTQSSRTRYIYFMAALPHSNMKVVADTAERSIISLPEFARDQNAMLTRAQTLQLLENVQYSGTLAKKLLPVVRRNAMRFGYDIYSNAPEYLEQRAKEVEVEFRKRGLISY